MKGYHPILRPNPVAKRLDGRLWVREKRGRAVCEERLARAVEFINDTCKPDTAAYWQNVREFAKRDYWFYLRFILDYRWIDPWFHGDEVVSFMAAQSFKEFGLLLPRGSGKSGLVTTPLAPWLLARDVESMCAILNAGEEEASRMAILASTIISDSERYKLAFPHVVKSIKRWGAKSGFFVGRSSYRKEPSITSFGVKGNMTGNHPNVLLVDDLLSSEMAKYPEQVAYADSCWNEAMNLAELDSTIALCSTRWVTHDFCGKLLAGSLLPKSGEKLPILKLGASRYEKDSSGQWWETLIWPSTTYVDMHGRDVRVGYTWSVIDGKRTSDISRFPALYYNEPQSLESRMFDADAVMTFKDWSQLPFEPGAVRAVLVETEGAGVAFFSGLVDYCRREKRRLPLRRVDTKDNPENIKIPKDDRIRSNLQNYINGHDCYIRDDLFVGGFSIGQEIRDFPRGYKDCLDSLAYIAHYCPDTKVGETPVVMVAIDPAYSVEAASAYTAIVAGCKYDGSLYVLDCERFQTTKMDVQGSKLFKVVDKFNSFQEREKNYSRKVSTIGGAKNMREKGGSPRVEIDCPWIDENGVLEHDEI